MNLLHSTTLFHVVQFALELLHMTVAVRLLVYLNSHKIFDTLDLVRLYYILHLFYLLLDYVVSSDRAQILHKLDTRLILNQQKHNYQISINGFEKQIGTFRKDGLLKNHLT